MLANNVGTVPGSWDSSIDLVGSERAWIRFLPMETHRRIGDIVRYCDSAIVALRAAHLDYFLCSILCNPSMKVPLDKQWSITAYHQKQGWTLNRYESH